MIWAYFLVIDRIFLKWPNKNIKSIRSQVAMSERKTSGYCCRSFNTNLLLCDKWPKCISEKINSAWSSCLL